MTEDLDRSLRAVFAELFRVDPASLTDDVRRGRLKGWDSLAHLTLVADLEARFGVTIDAERALEIETFGDARRVVAELAAGA